MGALAVLVLLVVALTAVGGVGKRAGMPQPRNVEPAAVMLVAGGDSQPGPPPPIEEPRASRYEEVKGMAVCGRTVVAFGRRAPQPRNERLDLVEPLAWWSTDQGETWRGASVPGKGGLRAVAAAQAGFVAVGEIVEDAGSRAVVLASEDGRTWTEESVAGLTNVGETLLEDGYGRAFVSLESMGGWAEPDLLEPSDTWPGHSVRHPCGLHGN